MVKKIKKNIRKYIYIHNKGIKKNKKIKILLCLKKKKKIITKKIFTFINIVQKNIL